MGRPNIKGLPCPFPDCFRCPYPDCIKERIFSGWKMSDQELQAARAEYDRMRQQRDSFRATKAKLRYHELEDSRA